MMPLQLLKKDRTKGLLNHLKWMNKSSSLSQRKRSHILQILDVKHIKLLWIGRMSPNPESNILNVQPAAYYFPLNARLFRPLVYGYRADKVPNFIRYANLSYETLNNN